MFHLKVRSRIKHRWLTVAIWLGLVPLAGTAEPIIFPTGRRIDPPADVDVTYQVVPSYDNKEKVVAVWDGENLQFFIHTRPELPAELREDTDDVVAIEGDSFTVKSRLSGERRVFKRAAQQH